jgi:hypothetical protein
VGVTHWAGFPLHLNPSPPGERRLFLGLLKGKNVWGFGHFEFRNCFGFRDSNFGFKLIDEVKNDEKDKRRI